MMRSLYSGVSGLKNHQVRMDVIGNNIANVNTTAFKASRTVFQDVYSQTVRAASAGIANVIGATNPSQIGLGVKLGTVDLKFTSAPTARTDNPSDLAIEGDGLFVVQSATTPPTQYYTRAGNFYIDNNGYLLTSDGYYVMGTLGTPPAAPDNTNLVALNISTSGSGGPPFYTSVSFTENGEIKGLDSTGSEVIFGQIAIATFPNYNGLQKIGGSLYRQTSSTGPVTVVPPNDSTAGSGKINYGGLEMSNVDLADEFTDMIITQRGFQANSRVITVSDTMLEELISLKR